MPAYRRALLSTTGALAALTAGCLASRSTDGRAVESPSTPLEAPPTVYEPRLTWDDVSGLSTPVESDADRPFRQFEVGASGYADAVRVWNDADTREGRVVVTTGDVELLDLTAEFPADGYLVVVFREREDYRVTVSFGEVDHTVELLTDRFDRDEAGRDVAVHEAGVESRTTREACEYAV